VLRQESAPQSRKSDQAAAEEQQRSRLWRNSSLRDDDGAAIQGASLGAIEIQTGERLASGIDRERTKQEIV